MPARATIPASALRNHLLPGTIRLTPIDGLPQERLGHLGILGELYHHLPPSIFAPLARRRRTWALAGRALAAARRIQREPEGPLLGIAYEAGYADHRAMSRALLRAFGVTPGAIRGTVGWEWLMWRFVTGLGEGRGKAWDQ